MQNTERQKFEENWKSAFDGAEMTPSDNVWNSIELDLAGQESAAMKKRVIFWQRLAAATVLFALITGIYAFYPRTDESKIVVNKNVEQKSGEVKSPEVKSPEVKSPEVKSGEVIKSSTPDKNEIPPVQQADKPVTIAIVPERESEVSETIAIAAPPIERKEEVTAQVNETVTVTESAKEPVKEPVVSPLLQTSPLVASLEPTDKPERNEKKKNSENMWLGLAAAAGNYVPNALNSGNADAAMAADQMQSSGYTLGAASPNTTSTPKASKVGSSVSFGLAVGKKLGRFVLQSGLNFGKQQMDYISMVNTTTRSNTSKAAIMEYANSDSFSSSVTTPYTVNSTMEMISVPLQAGYLIVDRRVGWQVNAGVSPDFFIKNTLVDKTGQRETFSQNAGSSSPYRTVNFSGLFNTELSVKMGTHYRFSLVPGVRYSFNSLMKEPTQTGKPFVADIGFRLKYIFE